MKELNSWREQDVHKEVPNEGQHIISVRWVIKPKIIDGQHSTKARLCSGGRGGVQQPQCQCLEQTHQLVQEKTLELS